MSVLVSTAYMEEAAQFDQLVAMVAGHVLATGTPAEFYAHRHPDLDAAFIASSCRRRSSTAAEEIVSPRPPGEHEVVVGGRGLTQRSASFTAVDHVSSA